MSPASYQTAPPRGRPGPKVNRRSSECQAWQNACGAWIPGVCGPRLRPRPGKLLAGFDLEKPNGRVGEWESGGVGADPGRPHVPASTRAGRPHVPGVHTCRASTRAASARAGRPHVPGVRTCRASARAGRSHVPATSGAVARGRIRHSAAVPEGRSAPAERGCFPHSPTPPLPHSAGKRPGPWAAHPPPAPTPPPGSAVDPARTRPCVPGRRPRSA